MYPRLIHGSSGASNRTARGGSGQTKSCWLLLPFRGASTPTAAGEVMQRSGDAFVGPHMKMKLLLQLHNKIQPIVRLCNPNVVAFLLYIYIFIPKMVLHGPPAEASAYIRVVPPSTVLYLYTSYTCTYIHHHGRLLYPIISPSYDSILGKQRIPYDPALQHREIVLLFTIGRMDE